MTTAPPDDSNYLVVGLAVGIPCGFIILVLLILIVVMVIVSFCNSR